MMHEGLFLVGKEKKKLSSRSSVFLAFYFWQLAMHDGEKWSLECTRPLARPLARVLAPLCCSLTPYCSLRSRVHPFVRSLYSSISSGGSSDRWRNDVTKLLTMDEWPFKFKHRTLSYLFPFLSPLFNLFLIRIFFSLFFILVQVILLMRLFMFFFLIIVFDFSFFFSSSSDVIYAIKVRMKIVFIKNTLSIPCHIPI